MNVPYSPDKLDALYRALSPGRVAPYLAASGGDLGEAIRLYELNARFSAHLYGPLQALEVTVRNAIDMQFCHTFGADWAALGSINLQPRQQDDLRKALQEVAVDEEGNPRDFTHDAVVAKLNFGFWVGVLGPKNEVEIWRKSLWRAFPNRPKGTERKAVQGALNSVRRLRNRVAHHCRIIHRDLEQDHNTILEIVGWICPDTMAWTASLSDFDTAHLPVSDESLPFSESAAKDDGLAAIAAPEKTQPTRGGRARLGIKP